MNKAKATEKLRELETRIDAAFEEAKERLADAATDHFLDGKNNDDDPRFRDAAVSYMEVEAVYIEFHEYVGLLQGRVKIVVAQPKELVQ